MAKSFRKETIALQEAMTMPLTQSVRVWHIPGLHIEDEDIPKNADVQTTFVMKTHRGHIEVGINYTVEVEGDVNSYTGIVAEVSALEELKDKFPKLFELNGSLYAFA